MCFTATPCALLQHRVHHCNTVCISATPCASLQHRVHDCSKTLHTIAHTFLHVAGGRESSDARDVAVCCCGDAHGVAVWCSVLPLTQTAHILHTTIPHIAEGRESSDAYGVAAVMHTVLQCVAVCCSVLQCVATYPTRLHPAYHSTHSRR